MKYKRKEKKRKERRTEEKKRREWTHRQSAGVLGGDVEVDHVLAHDDVGNPVAVVGYLQQQHTPGGGRVNQDVCSTSSSSSSSSTTTTTAFLRSIENLAQTEKAGLVHR